MQNNIIENIENKIYNCIERKSKKVSDKNSLFNYTFNYLIKEYFDGDSDMFNNYLDTHYFNFLNVKLSNLNIYNEYIRIIKHILIRYHCISLGSVINKYFTELTESDWDKMFKITLEEKHTEWYHGDNTFYDLKITINNPEVIDILSSKILKHFKLRHDGVLCDANNNNIITWLFNNDNCDINIVNSLNTDIIELKKSYSDFKEIINKITLHNF
jgi:hypothetical protein